MLGFVSQPDYFATLLSPRFQKTPDRVYHITIGITAAILTHYLLPLKSHGEPFAPIHNKGVVAQTYFNVAAPFMTAW